MNDRQFTNEQRYDPTEADHAPAGHPLSGCIDANGVPMPYSAALKADPTNVIVRYNGMPLRASQALAMGLCTREQMYGVTQQQPAATSASTQRSNKLTRWSRLLSKKRSRTRPSRPRREPLFDEQAQHDVASAHTTP